MNGDILFWNELLDCAFELSSMGIRVDPESLDRQLTIAGCDDRRERTYHKMPPDIAERDVIIVDPMLATGGSASAAVQFMKEVGCKHIKLMCIIGAPEGVAVMQKEHPDVDIYVAALDDHLNEHGYIVPGLGDAGDRIFGTK